MSATPTGTTTDSSDGIAEVTAATTGRDRDRHCQHVIGDQTGRRKEPGHSASVRAGDDVGAATMGIGADGLPVGQSHRQHREGDRGGNRQRPTEAGSAGEHKNREHRLGAVRHRRQRVRRKDRERDQLSHPFLNDRAAPEWRSEHRAPDAAAGRPPIQAPALIVDRRLELVRRRAARLDLYKATPPTRLAVLRLAAERRIYGERGAMFLRGAAPF